MDKLKDVKGKNILLLQGPVGLFFKKLNYQFTKAGATTYRIGLNAGDQLFSYRKNYTAYRGTPDAWEGFVKRFLKEKNIDKVFLFGDCRFYQSVVIGMAKELDIDIYVFEEGYIRPHYITLERHGVNDYSRLPRDPEFYDSLEEIEIDEPLDSTPNAILNWSIVIAYYFVAKLFHFRYRHYMHHRNYSATQEFFFGIRSLIRKLFYVPRDKKYIERIEGEMSKKYFFVPLQTHNDFQILQHSDYGSIEKFIIEVLESFARFAPDEDILMFKHHPIDRGRKHYTDFIYEQAKYLHIEKRILVLHDVHLPTCLKHAKGTVTINSTVGLSSLYHNTPTIALGRAVYDIKELTCQGMSLDDFWTNYATPDETLFQKYRQYVITQTQLNGNFYGLFPKALTYE